LKRKSDECAAFLFLGSASGIASAGAADAYAAFVNDQVNANMGYGASGAGDVNGDGFDDVIVGAYHYDCGQKSEGAAFVFLGGMNSNSGSQRGSCAVVRVYSVRKIAAAVALLLGIAGVLAFLLRRRLGARSSSS
jgi:FG-GAP repeat